ncbi:MAG: hypothetical protein JSV81_00945 [Anaerolineales bacterium]|nr:MAG: hypothetical protein JSV81_00945 [Anaerolineales bacterium]
MNIYLVMLLRIVHILAGSLWVGGAVAYFGFVGPSVKASGPAGGHFMQNFIERRKYPIYMTIASALTVLAGVPLYLFASGGLQLSWITSGPGVVFSIGSVVAIVVFFLGTLMIAPRAQRMGALGKEIGMAGGPPSPAQAAELQQLDREMARIELADFVLLMIATLTMATARYWFI